MINFHSEMSGTSKISPLFASVASSAPIIGYVIPGYSPDLVVGRFTQRRSFVDNIMTGPKRSFGDRECDNLQVTGDVSIPADARSGVSLWDPNYGIPLAQQHAPPSGPGFSVAEMVSSWGMSKSYDHVWKSRVQPGIVSLNGFPDLPFVTGGAGSAVSYYAANDMYGFNLFCSQEMVLSYRTFSTGSGRSAVFLTYATWNRDWDYGLRLTRSSGNVQSFFYAVGPSAAGARDYCQWWPDPNGVWNHTTASRPPLPQNLKFLTRETFVELLATPSRLTSWNPFGAATLFEVPSWTPATFPSTLWKGTVSYVPRDFEDSVSAAMRQIGEHFAPLYPVISSLSLVDDWQELGDRAADNLLQTSVNHYANAQQISKTLSILRTTLQLTKNWQNPKSWANWWLSLRYGDRLTLKDLAEDVNAVVRSLRDQTRTRDRDFYVSRSQSHTTGTGVGHVVPAPRIDHYLKLYYSFQDYGWWGRAYVFARQWALWPTTAAGWDVIPFSFVVDWFADVQSLFEVFDRDTLLLYVNVLSVIMTEKATYDFGDVALGDICLQGAKVTHYKRSLGTSLPSGPFRVDRGHSTAVNVVDGISLVIQVI